MREVVGGGGSTSDKMDMLSMEEAVSGDKGGSVKVESV